MERRLAVTPDRGGVGLQDRAARMEARVTNNPLQGNQDAIRDGLKDASRWLTYSGDYSNQRHSPLT